MNMCFLFGSKACFALHKGLSPKMPVSKQQPSRERPSFGAGQGWMSIQRRNASTHHSCG